MKIKQTAEQILGRALKESEGIPIEEIEAISQKLKLTIPPALQEYYNCVGNISLFMDDYQHVAQINELFVNDGKLVFMEENQGVVYWSVDLEDKETVYQTVEQKFDKAVEWYAEEFKLEAFLILNLYYQCLMSDNFAHEAIEGGFEFCLQLEVEIAKENPKTMKYLNNLAPEWTEVIRGNDIAIFWKEDSIMSYLLLDKSRKSDSKLIY